LDMNMDTDPDMDTNLDTDTGVNVNGLRIENSLILREVTN